MIICLHSYLSTYILSKMWDLSEYVRCRKLINISYIRMDGKEVKRKIKQLTLIFSEYYFYLIAYLEEWDSLIPYRVDRIKGYEDLKEHFFIKDSERFESGEFRKRVQFMYPGDLEKIKFEFWGKSLEAVLDRIPTAIVKKEYDGKYLIEAEVYGKGIFMWILSQGKNIKLIAPEKYVIEFKEIIKQLNSIYHH